MSPVRAPVLPTTEGSKFAARQREYFSHADAGKFRWQTTSPFFAASEQRLISAAAGAGRLLEVGCGEGGNLFHLGSRCAATVGLDYATAKLAFASGAIPWAWFVSGDAASLPFGKGVFDRVLCRDVLHHLEPRYRRPAVMELFRVCRPGGEVVLIEPNGCNPLIAALALLTPAERGLLTWTPHRVCKIIGAEAPALRVEMAQPFPIARALLHYRMGWPRLGAWRAVAWLLSSTDAMLGRVIPRRFWAYVIIRVTVPPAKNG